MNNKQTAFDTVLTSSSFSIRGRSLDLLVISSKLSNSPSELSGGTEHKAFSGTSFRAAPSTARQLLSAEIGRGAKSEEKESSGLRNWGVCRREPARSGKGWRITPALVLLGIQRARKSACEYWSPSGDDMMTVLPQARLANPGFEHRLR